MDPAEKLLADIQFWENEEKDAEKRLRYARAVLPGLRQSLDRLKHEGAPGEPQPAEPAPAAVDQAPPPAGEQGERPEGGELRFRGQALEQVVQALAAKAPQSTLDLRAFLAEHGRAFSRGAIEYALRDLFKAGKIREARKAGNLRYWEPV